MNEETLSQIDPVDLTAAQVVAVNGALKPKRKRKASPKPQQEAKPRKARKAVDPLLAEQQASKASATPHIASLTEGAQPFEARPAVVSLDAAGPSSFDPATRFVASVFKPVERAEVTADDAGTLTIAPAPVWADLSRGDLRVVAVVIVGVLILGAVLAIW